MNESSTSKSMLMNPVVRASLIVIAVGLTLIQGLQLAIQLQITQDVYALSALKKELKSISLEKQILEEELYAFGNLEELEIKASSLGMISSSDINFITISD